MKDAAKTNSAVLACTDDAVLSVRAVYDAMRDIGNGGADNCDPLIITCASSLSNFLSPLTAYLLCLSLHKLNLRGCYSLALFQ